MSQPSIDFSHIRHVVMDLDGTIYEGDTLYPETLPFLDALSAHGIRFGFITNNTSRSRRTYLSRLSAMGIPISSREQMLTPVVSTDDYLREHLPNARKLFILGSNDFRDEMQELGWIEPDTDDDTPDAVITAFDTSLTYKRLCRAAWWIHQGCPWIATHPDVFCPTNTADWLVDCGAITACIEASTGVHCSHVLGKPHPDMLQTVMKHFGYAPCEVMMIGDRERTDIASGHAAGAFTVRICTGDCDSSDTVADLVCENLGVLRGLMFSPRS